jgi:DNA polymerase III alpha subunit
MAALLTVAMGDKDKPRIFLTEAKSMGIRVMPPDINRSFNDFAVVEREEEPGSYDILFGLTAIRGVGEGVVREMRGERERHGFFTSIYDVIRRMPALNKTVLHALVKGGALDGTGATRKGMFDVVEDAQKAIKKERETEEKAFITSVRVRAEAAATATAAAAEIAEVGEQQSLLVEAEGVHNAESAFAAAVGPGRGVDSVAKSKAKGAVKLTMEEKRALEGGCRVVWAAGLEIVEAEVVAATEDALKKEVLRLARKDAKDSLKGESDTDISGIAQEEQSETSLKDRAEELAQAELTKQAREVKKQAAEFAQRFLVFIREEVSEREGALELDAALAAESDPALSTEEWDRIELLNVERKMLGIYVTGHPLDEDAEQWRAYVNEGTERGRELGQVSDADIGNTVIVVGAIVAKVGTRMRSGETMFRVTLEDLSGSREVTIFPRTLEGGLDELLTDGQIVCMEVGVQEDTFQQQRNDEAAAEEGEVMGADDEDAAELPIKLIASRLYRWDASKITPEFVAKAQARAAARAAEAAAAGLESDSASASEGVAAAVENDGDADDAAVDDAVAVVDGEVTTSLDAGAEVNAATAAANEAAAIKPVTVTITSAQFNPEWVKRLEGVCSQHPGTHPVKLVLDRKPYSTKFAVRKSPELAEAIRALLHSPTETVPAPAVAHVAKAEVETV